MRYLLSIAIAGLLAVGLQLSPARAGSIKDCEAITAPDAYNQCLASFGPVAHEHELKPVPANIGSGQIYGRHRHYAHGRKSMELSVDPSGSVD